MTSGQKIAFSLLSAVVLFAGFIVCAHAGLMKNLEARYYSQTIIKQKTEQLDVVGEGLNNYIQNILNKVEQNEDSYLKSSSVASFIDQNPSESQIVQRKKETEQLFVDLPELTGIRIIDKNGKNVHYSTFDETDLLKVTGLTKIYKYYPDIKKDGDELDYSVISVSDIEKKHKIFIDDSKNRLIISFPFYWFNNIYAGSLVCYFNLSDIEQTLVNQNVLTFGESITAFSEEKASGGIVIGVPAKETSDFKQPVQKSWKNGVTIEPEKVLALEDGRFWMLITSGKSTFLKLGGVYTSDIFQLSKEIIYLIYGAVGITLFLIAFLVFSFAAPKDVTIKKKIKKIQYGILKEYIDNKEKIEWSKAVDQLKNRQKELSEEILKDAGVHSKRKRKQMDEFLEKTWEEIFSALDSSSKSDQKPVYAQGTPSAVSGISLDELKRALKEVLEETQPVVKVVNQSVPAKKSVHAAPVVSKADDVEEIEEIEEIDEAEPVEDIEEVEEAEAVEDIEEVEEAEAVEDIEEVEEAEPVEEIEEIDEAEPVEEIEEIDEAEPVEEIEEVEEAEAVEEIEEIDEAEPVEEIEEIDEAEPVEEIAEVEEAEPAEEVAEAEEAEPAEEIEEVEETEPVEEIPETESAETVEEVAEVEESEPVETVEEEIAEAEEMEAVDELEDVEEIEELEELEELEEEKPHKSFEPDFSAFTPPPSRQYEYVETNDTFIDNTSHFATVDNLFAEVLGLGDVYIKPTAASTPLDFTVYQLNEEEQKESETEVLDELDSIGEAEELSEKIEDKNKYYSMIRFGQNAAPVKDLDGDSKDTIVENNGVFSIADNLETSNILLDKDLKGLIDSVTKKSEEK